MIYKSICAIKGVTAYGVKEGKFGLALIRASGTADRRVYRKPRESGAHRTDAQAD